MLGLLVLAPLCAEDLAAYDDSTGDPAALLRILKEQSPQTQLIATSAAADSELIIGLINEARICRFLRRPVNFSLLQGALSAALGRYARMAKSPALLRAARGAEEIYAVFAGAVRSDAA